VKFPSTRGAAAVLHLEAEVGAVKVRESGRTWVPRASEGEGSHGPYRTPAAEVVVAPAEGSDDEQLEAILARVADGSLSPTDASSLLRALGH
jgi:hypothetical protein